MRRNYKSKYNKEIIFKGEIIESYVIPSKDECLLLCRGEVTCQWFSYDLRQKICFLLYSCPELNENLVDYLSGQVNCQNTPGKYHNFKFKLPFCYSKIEEKKIGNYRLIKVSIS